MVQVRQVDLMRQLVAKHGRERETICALYAQAERDGIVERKRIKYGISAEGYAAGLYRDGERKGWF